jgi:hypothetical protein
MCVPSSCNEVDVMTFGKSLLSDFANDILHFDVRVNTEMCHMAKNLHTNNNRVEGVNVASSSRNLSNGAKITM